MIILPPGFPTSALLLTLMLSFGNLSCTNISVPILCLASDISLKMWDNLAVKVCSCSFKKKSMQEDLGLEIDSGTWVSSLSPQQILMFYLLLHALDLALVIILMSKFIPFSPYNCPSSYMSIGFWFWSWKPEFFPGLALLAGCSQFSIVPQISRSIFIFPQCMATVWVKNCELMVNLNQNLVWLLRQEMSYSSPVLDLDLFMTLYCLLYNDYLYTSSFLCWIISSLVLGTRFYSLLYCPQCF